MWAKRSALAVQQQLKTKGMLWLSMVIKYLKKIPSSTKLFIHLIRTFSDTHSKAASLESKLGMYFSVVLYGDMIYP